MIRRPPRSTRVRSSAASDVYKRQAYEDGKKVMEFPVLTGDDETTTDPGTYPVSYTHLRAHETPEHLVCRLLLAHKTPEHLVCRLLLEKKNPEHLVCRLLLKN